ncbi:MAG: DUF4177 domain-containing protein [Pseudomonadota bacterium]
MAHEYRVIPAPAKGTKAPGAKTPDARYAAALAQVLNDEAADGWEFVRAEVLPTEERQGLTGSKTVFVNVLVFRRAVFEQADPSTEAALRMLAEGDGEA